MANQTDVVNPLYDLMKAKYGITKQGTLKLTDKDDLKTMFRKIANYIYKNGDWSEQDYTNAYKTYLETLFGLEKVPINIVDFAKDDKQDYFAGHHLPELATMDVYAFIKRYVDDNGTSKTFGFNREDAMALLIDPKNKSWANQGKSYRFRNDLAKEWVYSNQNYALGYGKLIDDLSKEWQEHGQAKYPDISLGAIKEYLSSRVKNVHVREHPNSELAKITTPEFLKYTEPIEAEDNRERPFESQRRKIKGDAPDKFKQVVGEIPFLSRRSFERDRLAAVGAEFCTNYIKDTYNIIQQQKYERDLAKLSHARAFEQKKNINKATRKVMEQSPLNNNFRALELDNEVDLKLFAQFEPEIKRLADALPTVKGAEQPALRLRKIHNHGSGGGYAIGLYFPAYSTIVTDFRDGGIRSFAHEYGHHLDYQLGQSHYFKLLNGHESAIKMPLSLSANFRPILEEYRQNLKKMNLDDKAAGYYTIPTEVFARGHEVWLSDHLKVRSNALENAKQLDATTGEPQYRAFTPELRQKLFAYYDQLPGFEQAKERLQGRDFSAVPEKQLVPPSPAPKLSGMNLEDDHRNLAGFAKQTLEKWTETPERLEQLISGTGYQLTQPSANRVMAFDKLQTKALPEIVTESQLRQLKINPRPYRDLSMPVFEKVMGDEWLAVHGYSLAELQKADLNQEKVAALTPKVQKVPSKAALEPMLKNTLAEGSPAPMKPFLVKIETRMLEDALIKRSPLEQSQVEPFKFTATEREQLSKMNPNVLKSLYKHAAHDAKLRFDEIQRELSKAPELGRQQQVRKPKSKHHVR